MLFRQYKSSHTYIFKDDKDGKWFAYDYTTASHTEKFDSVDQLSYALNLNKVTWKRNYF